MKTSKVLKAYRRGEQDRVDGKPSNMPKELKTKDEQKAWRNGYNSISPLKR